MISISFTGHRPNRLFGYSWKTKGNIFLMKKMEEVILSIISIIPKEESIHFICGGALGVDQMAFDIVSTLRDTVYSDRVTVELAIPYMNFPNVWNNAEDIIRYTEHIGKANKVTYVDRLREYDTGNPVEVYHYSKLQKRNEYMVDNSDVVVAIWDGHLNGGTFKCIKYAEKQGKRIIPITVKKGSYL